MKREYRACREMELRQEPGGSMKIRGYPSVFNQLSEQLPGFRELVLPGAFKNSLKADVRALVSHDPSQIIGRTKNGTLKLREDDHGLYAEIDPPDTQLGRDTVELIRRGYLDQMSFGFHVLKDNWPSGKEHIRELVEVELFDVSVVAFPAYSQTEVSVRSLWPDGMPEELIDSIVVERIKAEKQIEVLPPSVYRTALEEWLKECQQKPKK